MLFNYMKKRRPELAYTQNQNNNVFLINHVSGIDQQNPTNHSNSSEAIEFQLSKKSVSSM